MKVSLKTIENFMNYRNLAIAGVSRNQKKFGYLVYNSLLVHNKEANFFPVNPHIDPFEQKGWYPDVLCLPEYINHLLILTPKNATNYVMETAIEKGIENIWIQKNSETPEVFDMASQNNINLITGYCFLMFSKSSGGIHHVHKAINQLLGKMPE